jgi:hypothetical protein
MDKPTTLAEQFFAHVAEVEADMARDDEAHTFALWLDEMEAERGWFSAADER